MGLGRGGEAGAWRGCGRQTQQELWAGLGAHPYKGFSAPCPIKHAHRAPQLLPAVPCLSLLARTALPSPASSSFVVEVGVWRKKRLFGESVAASNGFNPVSWAGLAL